MISSLKILTLSTNETGRQARSQRPIFDNAPLRARRRKHKKGSICQSQYSLRRSASLKICRANTSLATRKSSLKNEVQHISELHNKHYNITYIFLSAQNAQGLGAGPISGQRPSRPPQARPRVHARLPPTSSLESCNNNHKSHREPITRSAKKT